MWRQGSFQAALAVLRRAFELAASSSSTRMVVGLGYGCASGNKKKLRASGRSLPPSGHSGHSRTCCWLDPVAIDPTRTRRVHCSGRDDVDFFGCKEGDGSTSTPLDHRSGDPEAQDGLPAPCTWLAIRLEKLKFVPLCFPSRFPKLAKFSKSR